jgi:uncharacterized protein YcfJ
MSIRTPILLLSLGLVAAMPVLADHGDWDDAGDSAGWSSDRAGASDYDYAQVLRVDPQFSEVTVSEPQRECGPETRYESYGGYDDDGYDARRAATGTVVGGLIGAVIGHGISGGRDRSLGTVAGAVIGGAIGHDAGSRGERYPRPVRAVDVERCRVAYHERVERRVDGYRVRYRYNGRDYCTVLPYDPGERLRVRVTVSPDGA